MTEEQKKQAKMKFLTEIKTYNEAAMTKTTRGEDAAFEMSMVKIFIGNIEAIDGSFPKG